MMELSVTLRKRLPASPGKVVTPKPRSKAAEMRRARAKECSTLVTPHPSTKTYAMTSATRGEATAAFAEIKGRPVLKVTPKPPPVSVESLATRCARKAALARWHPSTNGTAPVPYSNGLVGEAARLVPDATEVRFWRRGESKIITGSYRQASASEILDVIDQIQSKQLKWTELALLYKSGQVRVSDGTVRGYLYGKEAAGKLAALRDKGEFEKMGSPRQVSNCQASSSLPPFLSPFRSHPLTPPLSSSHPSTLCSQVLTEAQENFGMALVIEMALRRRPLSESELCRWASATAARNGTRTGPAPDMRKWYIYAKGRILREFGINIEEVATQQLSKARAGVLLSGVRAWEATICQLLIDKPALAAEGLKAHGNSDEMKLDLYEVLHHILSHPILLVGTLVSPPELCALC
jgi:hypothetical protein